MSLDRERLLSTFRAAVTACDPARLVQNGLRSEDVAACVAGRRRFGVAIGKAALAMARGVGPVERGVIVVPAGLVGAGQVRDAGDGRDAASARDAPAFDFADVPTGWRVIESAHPFVDERSVWAARAAREVVDAAGEGDVVIALVSGGASALIEEPIEGITIEELGATTRAAMESGVSIQELNDLRSTMSRVKRGGLVASCAAPVVTLAVSDVIGDGLAIIGSGPTIGAWFVDDAATRYERVKVFLDRFDRSADARKAAITRAVERFQAGEPFVLDTPILGGEHHGVAPRERDIAMVVGHMAQFSVEAYLALVREGLAGLTRPSSLAYGERDLHPLQGDVAACAQQLVERVGVSDAAVHGTYVAWGEPTLRVPDDHGEGGRAQQLALLLAKALRGTKLVAMAIGSDGIDGPPPKRRPAPAGAIVDGDTWDAIERTGLGPEQAIERCDAGTVLDAVGALVVTGPTGINHGDLVIIGDRRNA